MDAEIERRRVSTDAADASGSRVELREHEPWPVEVDGAELINDLQTAILRYVALPKNAALATALWILHSHAHDASTISPLLTVISPEKRCGKTTLLEVIARLVPRSLHIANVTSAALFRAIEAWKPTVLIDEADTFLKHSEELRGVVNSGHNRSSAMVLRTVGDEHEPRHFRTWAPKVVAMIGNPAGTIVDRSVILRMRRRTKDQVVASFRADRDHGLGDLGRRCARWALDNHETLALADPLVPKGLHDRAGDNWRPLFGIAELAGKAELDAATGAALTLTRPDDEDSRGMLLLEDIRDFFQMNDIARVSSIELSNTLICMDERPWGDLGRGQSLTPHRLAQYLKPFDIKSVRMRFKQQSLNGYKVEFFEDAFNRYLDENVEADPIDSSPIELTPDGVRSAKEDFLEFLRDEEETDEDHSPGWEKLLS